MTDQPQEREPPDEAAAMEIACKVQAHYDCVLAALVELRSRLRASSSPQGAPEAGCYQRRVRDWVVECFGSVIADDMTERSFRFLEEALELAQSVGCTQEQAAALVGYVYGRPAGQRGQEVGGVMVTLAALTSAAGIDMAGEAERELARVSSPEVMTKIRRKQASKRGVVSHAAQAALPGEWSAPPSAGAPPATDRRPVNEAQCPKCGEWVEDQDGFGVLDHDCGYCSHPSRTGATCDICGDVEAAPPATEPEP